MEERLIWEAQKNIRCREQLIRENTPFICRCASVTLKRYVDGQDDAFSVALVAFNNAVDTYDSDKASFKGYAAVCIRNALISAVRAERKHAASIPMSSLSRTVDGKERPFDAEDPASAFDELSTEVFSLKLELARFDVAFSDLPAASPKTEKTRRMCRDAAAYIGSERKLLARFMKTGRLPSGELLEALPRINKKLLERHRAYIITGILIYAGKYNALKTYFDGKGGNG